MSFKTALLGDKAHIVDQLRHSAWRDSRFVLTVLLAMMALVLEVLVILKRWSLLRNDPEGPFSLFLLVVVGVFLGVAVWRCWRDRTELQDVVLSTSPSPETERIVQVALLASYRMLFGQAMMIGILVQAFDYLLKIAIG